MWNNVTNSKFFMACYAFLHEFVFVFYYMVVSLLSVSLCFCLQVCFKLIHNIFMLIRGYYSDIRYTFCHFLSFFC